MPICRSLCAALLVVGLTTCETSAALDQTITLSAGKHDRENTPASVTIYLKEKPGDVALVNDKGVTVVAQITAPGLLNDAQPKDGLQPFELHFIIDKLAAGATASYKLQAADGSAGDRFSWVDTEGKYTELKLGVQPVLRYMYRAYDKSDPQARFETYKVFHHVFDPAGERMVTNGPTGEEPYSQKVKFPHHRGLFYGFNRISYADGKKKADTWHCRGDAYLSHEGFLAEEAGPVLGRHRIAIDWHGQGEEVFASEQREMTVYHTAGGHLIEFASRLTSKAGEIKLDGDPQHAGFQFRASNDVASKTAKESYYVRVDGVGKPGATRNWPANKDHADLPWNALSFVLGGQRYTAAYLDRPENPKEARFSERDYGRFGSYFQYDLTPEKPLDLNYRVWLQAGEMTVAAVAAKDENFVDPPEVAAK
jgi:hypothetical protein